MLVIAATEMEIAPTLRRLERATSHLEIDTLVTGVGKAAAACEIGMRLVQTAYDLHVQVGCAGAYPSSRLAIGDVVLGTEETFADEGVETPRGFLDLKDLGLAVAKVSKAVFNRVPLARVPGVTWKTIAELTGRRYGVRRGRLATVSACSGTDERATRIEARWQPLAESMEGAAAALAVLKHGARLFEVRGISNRTGSRFREGWDLEAACEHAAEVAAWLIAAEARMRPRAGRRSASR